MLAGVAARQDCERTRSLAGGRLICPVWATVALFHVALEHVLAVGMVAVSGSCHRRSLYRLAWLDASRACQADEVYCAYVQKSFLILHGVALGKFQRRFGHNFIISINEYTPPRCVMFPHICRKCAVDHSLLVTITIQPPT